ncbi:hypothetical protein [Singulisphaera sp. PoT]|uniref:hypothetical protein n=1 Tax=Singulisphaera sp. PoT TaxID=3411797 RepID=UPI003BF5C50C
MGMIFVALSTGALGCAGTGQVRYVYQDGQSGVIGLPENTSRWPTYYRQHAEELMSKHFPSGYEIVRAEEVEEGSRTLTINGTNAAELATSDASKILSLGKIGRTSSRTQADTLKIKECRIVYKKTAPTEHVVRKPGEYTDQAVWNPSAYIDPNTPIRDGSAKKLADAGAKKKDGESDKDKDKAKAAEPGTPTELAKEPKDAKPDEPKKAIPVKAAAIGLPRCLSAVSMTVRLAA